MHEFKSYQITADIDFINNNQIIGDYHKSSNERLEMKAIRKYKDTIWEMQGLFNNSMAYENNDFRMHGQITLFGKTYGDNLVVMRHLELTL